MVTPKWYNMFPHGNYGILNLDFLLQKYGEQDERIKKVEEKNVEQDTRLDADEADIGQLQDDMSQAKDDIDSLEDKMDTAESDIDSLEDRMDTAERDIDSLEGRMDTAEGDIGALETAVGSSSSGLIADVNDLKEDVSGIKQDIIDIDLKDQAQDNDIDGLDYRVTALEQESAVIANPGGTGANLNTISIDNVTYVIPSGGGGGGGSSVTPNPAGTPTATLNTVDIDGTIYDMPVDASDISDINNDISALDTRIETLEETVGDTGTRSYVANSAYVYNSSQVQTIPDTQFVIPDGTLALCCASISVDTTSFGSTPRYLGFYIREAEPVEPVTWTNAALAKFIVNGDEPAMITEAANMNLTKVLGPGTYQLAVRVNANTPTPRQFHYSASADIVTLRNVGV